MKSFIDIATRPFRMKWFLLTQLPVAFFCGIRIKTLTDEKCVVTVPFTWLTKNPFRSTYFACLAMAAEMSTGALAMANTYGREPKVSMLLTEITGEYLKKATGITSFICRDGIALRDAIEEAIATNGSNVITIHSMGTNEVGELVASFNLTWSFKTKTPKRKY